MEITRELLLKNGYEDITDEVKRTSYIVKNFIGRSLGYKDNDNDNDSTITLYHDVMGLSICICFGYKSSLSISSDDSKISIRLKYLPSVEDFNSLLLAIDYPDCILID